MSAPKFELSKATVKAGYAFLNALRNDHATLQARYDRQSLKWHETAEADAAGEKLETFGNLADEIEDALPEQEQMS